jgi:hypothetical protein
MPLGYYNCFPPRRTAPPYIAPPLPTWCAGSWEFRVIGLSKVRAALGVGARVLRGALRVWCARVVVAAAHGVHLVWGIRIRRHFSPPCCDQQVEGPDIPHTPLQPRRGITGRPAFLAGSNDMDVEAHDGAAAAAAAPLAAAAASVDVDAENTGAVTMTTQVSWMCGRRVGVWEGLRVRRCTKRRCGSVGGR